MTRNRESRRRLEYDDWGEPIRRDPLWRPEPIAPECLNDTFPADPAEREQRAEEVRKIRNRLRRSRGGAKEEKT